ncbi:hypothetical protein F4820DRAFT_339235 [Hypoxylon rubiginosum]|uniref:Uncharacterized protein n=1 Tax=Hypoxylon rubiginosum TaxID=110542 RepID=A0ACB9YYZ0_9PEZI|nr:hypothetical protein F4820DRAFT_339235 [Hypoxylon rubiginosum]
MHHSLALNLIQVFSVLSILFIIYPNSFLVTASPTLNKRTIQANTVKARADISDVPSVQDIEAELQNHGRVGNDVSLFYTSLSGQSAIGTIKAWYQCNMQPISRKAGVAFDEILPPDYEMRIGRQLQSFSLIDKFQKRISQAFAAQSAGQVFVFYPDGKGDPIDICSTSGQGLNPPGGFSTWCGQEFPALMGNNKVDVIYQVDPKSDTKSGNIIWTRGDGEKLPIRQEQVN